MQEENAGERVEDVRGREGERLQRREVMEW